MRKILSFSVFYDLLQTLVGTKNIRQYFVDNYVKVKTGQSVLDIGCGTGELVGFLPVVDYLGIDPSGNYVKAAQRRFSYDSRIEFIRGTVSEVQPKIGKFDKVIMLGVLHHLEDSEAMKTLDFAARCLKPKGVFVSMDMCNRPNINSIAKLMNFLDRGRFIRSDKEYIALLDKHFPKSKTFDFCGRGNIPLSHFVFVGQK
jgi:ubiquinone/menaquinone biosynthesis C-methylase UbiE